MVIFLFCYKENPVLTVYPTFGPTFPCEIARECIGMHINNFMSYIDRVFGHTRSMPTIKKDFVRKYGLQPLVTSRHKEKKENRFFSAEFAYVVRKSKTVVILITSRVINLTGFLPGNGYEIIFCAMLGFFKSQTRSEYLAISRTTGIVQSTSFYVHPSTYPK